MLLLTKLRLRLLNPEVHQQPLLVCDLVLVVTELTNLELISGELLTINLFL
jgi:hypothetical protein